MELLYVNKKYYMLGIVIINYRSEQLTIDYIHKELCKITIPHVVVVVNNTGTKESNSLLCDSLHAVLINNVESTLSVHSNYYVINCSENLGFAKGNNLGTIFLRTHFSCEYVLFSNNDIKIVDADVCERLIEKMEAVNSIGLIGPKVIGLEGDFQSPEPYKSFLDRYCWMYLSTFFMSNEKKRKRFNLDYSKNAKEGVHYKVSGSFFMVRMKDFLHCEMMDPKTFLYAEETILSERLNRINKKVYYLPIVSVVHAHGVTTKSTIGKKGINKYLMESEIYYYREYMKTPMWKIYLGKFVHWLYCKIR